jgi:hypothetical protein
MSTFLGAVFIPFALGLVASLVYRRAGRVAALGLVVVPVGYFLAAWALAPSEPGERSDCGEYLGRWWEPWTVGALAVLGVAAWAIGAGLGRWGSRVFVRGAASP